MSVAKNTTNLTIRLDSDLKKDCEALYAELGMSLSTAINVFLRQSLRKGGLPLDARLDDQPNRTTIEAMLEAERIAKDPTVKRYNDLDELFKDLKS
jgi:DNA-damage-inducible protein J